MKITYATEPDLAVDEFADLLSRSTLATRRPADDRERLDRMLRGADLIVAARNAEGLLVGVARAISDFSFCTYLSDLAVDEAYQRQGIGRELLRQTHAAAGDETSLILHAAPAAADFYPHVGMETYDNCWRIRRRGDTTD
ncbi:MAG: GNAT family N-acetyltransferase [Planctomycetota bacterium]|nr:MAG: GNAT family N-acetyltransferase [Planctomycetota bacterium]